ncbi:MAG: starch-binding protein [Muribaculaceae bacterium]|nr:starch-binding protein [Muribaculaceae bacterium]
MKKFNIIGLLLLLVGVFTSCKEETIVLTSELPQFETREGLMLLEVIVPYETGINDKIYIVGDFNGGTDAIGNPEWLLQRAEQKTGVPAKFGIYLNPSSFIDGKTLADGYYFYNIQNGPERNIDNEPTLHYEAPALGGRLNVFVNYWESSFLTPENPDDVEHDGYAIYILNNSTWTDLYLWAWGDDGNILGADASWPGLQATGQMNINGALYTYFDTGTANMGKTVKIIISNNGSPQTPAPEPEITLDKDWYFELTADGTLEEIDPNASVSHDGYAIFIYNNNPDFAELYAWVWEEGSGGEDFLGTGWPGVPFTGTQMINGVVYNYFDFGSGNDGKTVNFIVNNNNQGKQAEVDGLLLDKNYYYELSGLTLTAIDPETFTPSAPEIPEEPDPDEPKPSAEYNIYVLNETGWSDFYLYTWGDTQFFGDWPGEEASSTVTIGGETYLVFPVEGAGETQHLIFNNGKSGDDEIKVEQGDMTVTFDQDYYIKVTATQATFLTAPMANIYVNNQTGWDDVYLYGWGDAGNSFFGDWPGTKGTETELINGVNYIVFPFEAVGLQENLIFNNGKDDNDGKEQLSDFNVTLATDMYIVITGNGAQFENQ